MREGSHGATGILPVQNRATGILPVILYRIKRPCTPLLWRERPRSCPYRKLELYPDVCEVAKA